MTPEEIYNSFIEKADVQYKLSEKQINSCFKLSKDSCTFNTQLFETINNCASEKAIFMENFFQSGPFDLMKKEAPHHSLYYKAVLYTHNLGMELINLPLTLSNSIQYNV